MNESKSRNKRLQEKFWAKINNAEPISNQIKGASDYKILMTRNENTIMYFRIDKNSSLYNIIVEAGNKEIFKSKDMSLWNINNWTNVFW